MKELEEGLKQQIQFEKRGGLVPVIVQDADSLEILMLGYANEAAVLKTVETGLATFWSTSRQELWTKGKTSGDYLVLVEILIDCDQDALIYKVNLQGDGTCHTRNEEGKTRRTCFYRKMNSTHELSFIQEMK